MKINAPAFAPTYRPINARGPARWAEIKAHARPRLDRLARPPCDRLAELFAGYDPVDRAPLLELLDDLGYIDGARLREDFAALWRAYGLHAWHGAAPLVQMWRRIGRVTDEPFTPFPVAPVRLYRAQRPIDRVGMCWTEDCDIARWYTARTTSSTIVYADVPPAALLARWRTPLAEWAVAPGAFLAYATPRPADAPRLRDLIAWAVGGYGKLGPRLPTVAIP